MVSKGGVESSIDNKHDNTLSDTKLLTKPLPATVQKQL